jgi:hypothetical protein
MASLVEECAQAHVLMAPYIEGRLNEEERAAMEEHLAACSACREMLQRKTAYVRLLEHAYADRRMPPRFKTPSPDILRETRFSRLAEDVAEKTETGAAETEIAGELGEEGVPQPPPMEPDEDGWQERLGAAPWWAISGVFHGLLLLLLGRPCQGETSGVRREEAQGCFQKPRPGAYRSAQRGRAGRRAARTGG